VSYDIGNLVRVSVNVTDINGVAADPTTIALTVDQPDGTLAGPYTPTHDGTGAYHYDFLPTQAGRHAYRFVATGTNAGAYDGAFDVTAAFPFPLATQADVEARLGRTLTAGAETTKVAALLADASAAIRSYTGQTITAVAGDVLTVDAPYTGELTLPERPVTAVTSITLDGVALTGWSWDSGHSVALPGGWSTQSSVTYPGRGVLRITYSHGYGSVPADVVAVCASMVLRAMQTTAGVRSETLGDYSVTYAGDGSPGAVGFTADERMLLNRYRRLAAIG
jgi:hypothetical protein